MTTIPPVPGNLRRRGPDGVLHPLAGHDMPPQIGDSWCLDGREAFSVVGVEPVVDEPRAWALTLSDTQVVVVRDPTAPEDESAG
jgi:hypothetical protein